MDTKESQLAQFAILAAPVVEWLEQGAPHIAVNKRVIGFNMEHVFYDIGVGKDFDKNTCGTVCCIAGAIGQFNYKNELLKKLFKESSYTNKAKDGVDSSMEVLELAFPLIANELEMLFNPILSSDDDCATTKPYSQITPKETLKTLKKFLKTGKVDWSHIIIET